MCQYINAPFYNKINPRRYANTLRCLLITHDSYTPIRDNTSQHLLPTPIARATPFHGPYISPQKKNCHQKQQSFIFILSNYICHCTDSTLATSPPSFLTTILRITASSCPKPFSGKIASVLPVDSLNTFSTAKNSCGLGCGQ